MPTDQLVSKILRIVRLWGDPNQSWPTLDVGNRIAATALRQCGALPIRREPPINPHGGAGTRVIYFLST